MPAAIDSSISLWAQNDPHAAGQWVGTLSGVARDRAASIYSNVVVQRNPAAAMTWALSIGDNSLRDVFCARELRTENLRLRLADAMSQLPFAALLSL